MSGPHRHALYLDRASPVHPLSPTAKIAAHLAFVLIVVATPREAFWAFAAYSAIIISVLAVARVPATVALRRLSIEVPFVAFALLLPFVATGRRIDVFGITLAAEGLWGAWNIVAKATIGTAASIALAATTTPIDLLRGLEGLKVPSAFTTTAGFMIRYADVIADDFNRMRIARESRGYTARWLWQARVIANCAGAMFVRSYERGERVFCAMQSRGFTGRMPPIARAGSRRDAIAAVVPLAAGVVFATTWVLR